MRYALAHITRLEELHTDELRRTIIGLIKFLFAFIGVLTLLLVTIVTLAALILFNQGDTIDHVDQRSCRNSGILIDQNRRSIQRQTPALYHSFLPNLTDAQVDHLIHLNVHELRHENAELRVGCSMDQLHAGLLHNP